jgi:serine/threonine-protein kinase
MQESLGDYRILERIGGGETADVFRARDTRSGRTVAIKVLTSPLLDDPVRRRQFLDDAQAAAALSHPNIAALYELGEHDHRPYLVFEFVQGQTLSALIGGHPLNTRRAIELAIQVADGLADAHASHLVHRAITPDTIIVTAKGNAKTIDFGLSGYLAAAPAYWAPEQLAGAGGDHRVDIYALGLVLIEMLTGRRPSSGEAPQGRLPGEVTAVVQRMIAADPDRRFDSAATLAAELRQVATAIDARPPVVAAVVSAAAGPRRVPRWMLVVLALAATAALIWLAWRLR